MTLLLIAIAGAVGAVLRDEAIALIRRKAARPGLRAVAAVNVSGTFALGLLTSWHADALVHAVVGGGLLGAYTTYSTWMVETVLSSRRRALANLAGQAGMGLAAVMAARAVGLVWR